MGQLDDRPIQLAQGIAELERSVEEISKELESANEQEMRDLQSDLNNDTRRLNEMYSELERIKSGRRAGDGEAYNKFLEYYRQARARGK